MNVFFVCGAPKSGTTWMQRILDAHPQVCCSGEGHFIQRFSTPAAQVINAYNSQLTLEAERVYEGRPYYGPVDQAEFDELVRGFILGRLQARADGETRWVGDKTPGYALQLDALHRLFPAAKIIHVVRDPRDVAVSHMGHSRRLGLEDVFRPETEHHRQSVEVASRLWRDAVTAADVFARAHPGVVYEVGYQDLHADPIGACERLFGFLGAPNGRVLMEQIAAATSFEALSGRPAGQEDPSSFLRKGVPDDWKTGLDAGSARKIAELCGDLMRQKRFA